MHARGMQPLTRFAIVDLALSPVKGRREPQQRARCSFCSFGGPAIDVDGFLPVNAGGLTQRKGQ